MLVFVDNEHIDAYAKPWGEKIMAARVRIKYRLEDITGDQCLIVRYNQITPELLQRLEAKAFFISGSSTNPDEYDPAEVLGLHSAITSKQWPVLGFCGGFEVMTEAFGARLAPIGALAEGEDDPNPNFAPGMKKEFGYQPITIIKSHPLLAGLGDAPVMRQAHSWEAKGVPPEFENYGETAVSPHQIFIHNSLPIVGTQFHPEYYTDEHPTGRVLIQNFCRLAGLIP